MVRVSKLTPRVMVTGTPRRALVDDSIISTQIPKRKLGRKIKSAMKRQKKTTSKQKSAHSRQKRSQKVTFDTNLTLAQVKKIPKAYAKDVWYTPYDVDKFRSRMFESREWSLKNKMKSARCRNHMRRVLFQHRISRDTGGKTERRQDSNREILNLSSVSMRSSEKQKEVAIRNAIRLQREIIADAACINPVSSACLGPSSRWSFDYYLGTMLDTLCTVE